MVKCGLQIMQIHSRSMEKAWETTQLLSMQIIYQNQGIPREHSQR